MPIAAQDLYLSGSYDLEKLVRNLFLGTRDVEVSNVRFTGAKGSLGIFSYKGGKLGIEEGFVMTTGGLSGIRGPNKNPVSGSENHQSGDPDLDAISKGRSMDAVVLEFDFVPVSEYISFRYVFASEEYLEFVNRGYNDAFGFFLSGPGIQGKLNLATVMGGQDVVSVNSINDVENPHLYIDNGSTSDPKTQANPRPIYDKNIQFDGFTKVLKARAKVQPYKTYHIKLAIADVGDRFVDSAVFLEARSFISEGEKLPPPPGYRGSTAAPGDKKRKPLPRSALVEFDFDSWKIPDTSRDKLYFMWRDIKDYPHLARIEIRGHTDFKGTDEYNKKLSEKRVASVVEFLVKLGYPREHIILREGLGESFPKMPNDTDEGRARNRRVEVRVLWNGK
ncbi:MAG: OmpA family protein [Flavobacteriales bacterium]|nr:OmpA family protein [Flavobacteriales bacterium]MDW8432524.1 OmpA family protein [Flavobacteriales bacterium]